MKADKYCMKVIKSQQYWMRVYESQNTSQQPTSFSQASQNVYINYVNGSEVQLRIAITKAGKRRRRGKIPGAQTG